MRKSYLFTVLLILLFIGTLVMTNNAWAVPMNCQEYQCTGMWTQYGQFDSFVDTCVELCTGGDPYMLYNEWFTGYLYPLNPKNLLGTADTFIYGWAGCSVERKGRTIIATLPYIQNDDGYILKLTCTPCNDCCMPIISDRRLKKFIKEVKGIYNQIGLKMYRWQWTKKAERKFGLKGYSAGVIAQEVKEKYPDAVVEYKGYLTVRYDYLNRLLLMQGG